MRNNKKYQLSLNGDTFNGFKSDFDQMLQKLLTDMEKRESEEATISIKMVVSLTQDKERDFEANGNNAMKDITKPSFKHEISTVMQVKNKKSGNLGGNIKLVWDRELCQYVMQEIDNGQVTLFDNQYEQPPEPERREPAAIPAGDVIEADYEVIEEQEGTEEVGEQKDSSGGAPTVSEHPYDYMKQFVGAEMRVTEAMGNYTVRTAENKVVLSSGFNATDRFYCSPEVLKPHVGHDAVCIGSPSDEDEFENICIWCEECDEVLFDIENPEKNAAPDDYPYEEPVEEQDEE